MVPMCVKRSVFIIEQMLPELEIAKSDGVISHTEGESAISGEFVSLQRVNRLPLMFKQGSREITNWALVFKYECRSYSRDCFYFRTNVARDRNGKGG